MATSRYPHLVGKAFTRQHIADMFRGNPVTYLPIYQGKVTCGCFRKDLNPDAPFEVLVGDNPPVIESAELLLAVRNEIPVFVKEIWGERWEYKGIFVAKRLSEDMKDIEPRAARATQPRDPGGDVVMVLFLDRVGD